MKKFKIQFEEVLRMTTTIEAESREKAVNMIVSGEYDKNSPHFMEEDREFRDLCEIEEIEDE